MQRPGDIQLRLLNSEGLEIGLAEFNGLPSGVRFGDGFEFIRIDPGAGALLRSVHSGAGGTLDAGAELLFVGGVTSFGYDLDG